MKKNQSEGFHLPLTEEQLNYYFEQYSKGDMCAREIIIKNTLGLVRHRVDIKYSDTFCSKEDLISSGRKGLLLAIDHYSLSKPFSFQEFAYQEIDYQIDQWIKNNDRNLMSSLEETELFDEDGIEVYQLDKMGESSSSMEEIYEKKEMLLLLYQWLDTLPERDREMIKWQFGFYGRILSIGELATLFGIHHCTIRNKTKKLLGQLKTYLETQPVKTR